MRRLSLFLASPLNAEQLTPAGGRARPEPSDFRSLGRATTSGQTWELDRAIGRVRSSFPLRQLKGVGLADPVLRGSAASPRDSLKAPV